MEILVTLADKEQLELLAMNHVDGIIFGSLFTNKFNFSRKELIDIESFCVTNKINAYISIDAFIDQNAINELDEYMKLLASLHIKGIYFNDFAVIEIAKKYRIQDKLIYDSSSIPTNANDIGMFINNNMGVVLARELSLSEIMEIVKQYPYKLDMQVFGHLRMSYSKRKLLSNYFKEINVEQDVLNNNYFTLQEETRNYRLPIKETNYGTCIYTDYILLMYEEFAYLNKLLKRVIFDSSFINKDLLLEIIRDAKRITPENAEFLKEALLNKHKHVNFSSGYLYKKTVDKKEENNED